MLGDDPGGVDAIKELIRTSFTTAVRPEAGTIHVSEQSDEASTLLEADFEGQGRWQDLDPSVLDQAPGGFGTALSFFSDEAFRYYLPAYLIADLDAQLSQADPVFHLTHGLTDATRDQRLAGQLEGSTWWEVRTSRLEAFTREERTAIVAYLEHRAATDPCARDDISQALRSYWAR